MMKDKLVRYNHKAAYYVFKKIGIGVSIVAASSILIALPISLGLNMVKSNEIAHAEEQPSTTTTTSNDLVF